MLVVARKVGEKIVIGHQAEIVVTVLGIRGTRIQLGIKADPSIAVHRVDSESMGVNRTVHHLEGKSHAVELAH